VYKVQKLELHVALK